MGKFKLNILFGEDAVKAYEENEGRNSKKISEEIKKATGGCYCYKELKFDTEAERNAYIRGVQDCDGWYGYIILDEKTKLKLDKS